MAAARILRWLLAATAVAALLIGAYLILHRPLAADDSELRVVAIDKSDPDRERVGDLIYRGGIDIPRMGQNIGGLSGLRWDADSGRLLAITDDARWVWLEPIEGNHNLSAVGEIKSGPLVGLDGEPLSGKAKGDSESLTRSADGGWLVGFERDHRVWRYPSLKGNSVDTGFHPLAILGSLDENSGTEALAGDENDLVMCAERPTISLGELSADPLNANCQRLANSVHSRKPFSAVPPTEIAELGGVPTDADMGSDGTLYILFRSYSKINGNGAAVVAFSPDGTRRELATLRPPLTVDNFEGLAVREEDERTFIYLVSDDNFSGSQRTLLMKFELPPQGK